MTKQKSKYSVYLAVNLDLPTARQNWLVLLALRVILYCELRSTVLQNIIYTYLVALVRERTIPTERPPLVGEVSASSLRIEGCHVVSTEERYGRTLAFLDRSSYYFFQVAPQLYSRG
jgi:hypothetical protein